MQTMKALRLGYAALCLLAIVAVSGCGQKGPLYREAPVAADVSETASKEPATVSNARDNEQKTR
ncbi:lipoprotein [Marinobacter sp. S0848L]|uniref:LPS translocon maturation chaperone LptM n=1 Tax=Marinobacter sp. S0848L TaxID=2926423 RepID=UPI001FF31E7C|nr:lipoprotein [Marinobacter sp. S0848L]MCK0106898.1 lipoprotein [Marinobacter sp. S0848L]